MFFRVSLLGRLLKGIFWNMGKDLVYGKMFLTNLLYQNLGSYLGLPRWLSGKESACSGGDCGSISGLGKSAGEGIGYTLQYSCASLVAHVVKNPPKVWETWVRYLDWEDPLEKGKATHSSLEFQASIFPNIRVFSGLENSMDCIIHGVTKSRTQLADFHFHFFSPPPNIKRILIH